MFTNLLWKDARQVFPSVAICLAMAVLGQVLFISRWLRNEDFFHYLDIPRSLAMIGPLLVALACAGMSFGNERQTRTVHWMSSLPIRWQQSLSSQMLVASACILVAAIVTHSIASFAPQVARNPEWRFLDQTSLSIAILVAVELCVFSIISALIFEETLYGLCAAGIASISMNALIGYVVEELLSYQGWNAVQANYDAVFYPALILLVVIMLLGSIWIFRWRWTLGQYVDCWNSIRQTFLGRWRLETESLAESIPQQARAMPASYPNRPFWTLFVQSLRQASYFRIALVLAPWAIALTQKPKEFHGDVIGYSILSAILLGLSCFVIDHAKYRFRFLADRGISAWKFYWARTIPLLGIVILMITAALFILRWFPSRHIEPVSVIYLAAIGCFFGGQLASLCFRNVLIAICASVAALFAIICMNSLFDVPRVSFGQFLFGPLDINSTITLVSTIASIAAYLIFAVYWLVPTWSRAERPSRRLAGGFVVSGILVPIFLLHAIGIAGYWIIPRPTWPSERLSPAERIASLPRNHTVTFAVKSKGELFDACGFPNRPTGGFATSIDFVRTSARYPSFRMDEIHALTLDETKITKALDWLTELEFDLDRSLVGLQSTSPTDFEITWGRLQDLQSHSSSCAAMARLAILRRQRELMKKCLDCLKKMEALHPWIDPVSRIDLHSRVLTVFSTCSDNDLKWVAESYSIDSLLSEVTSLAEYRRWAIERSVFVEKKMRVGTEGIADHDWEERQRYRWIGSIKLGDSSSWYSALPYSIARRELLYLVSREILAEVEMLDRLIDPASHSVASKGVGFSEPISRLDSRLHWRFALNPPYQFGFHLNDLIRYRDLQKSVSDRVSTLSIH